MGRQVFGLAAIRIGDITFVQHGFDHWRQLNPFKNIPRRQLLAHAAALSRKRLFVFRR